MSDLEHVAQWAHSLLARISPAGQRAVNRKVAIDLRRSQATRIASQSNPDGSPFEPRKPRRLVKKGSVRRRAMFTKIRTSKYLRTSASAEDLAVGFNGRIARIANVHQKGLNDRVAPNGVMVRYASRVLLGFTDADLNTIADSLLKHLAGRDT